MICNIFCNNYRNNCCKNSRNNLILLYQLLKELSYGLMTNTVSGRFFHISISSYRTSALVRYRQVETIAVLNAVITLIKSVPVIDTLLVDKVP